PFAYPGGADRSHQLVDLLAALKCQFPRQVHFLLGNHELSQVTRRRIAKGERDFNQSFLDGVRVAYGIRAEEVYAHYEQLFAIVPLAVRTSNRIFLSHSLPPAARLPAFDAAALEREPSAEADLLPGGSIHTLVWGRDTSAAAAAGFLKRVNADWLVTGHIPCEGGFDTPSE